MLSQDTTHVIQKPCYQRGSPCQDPAGNWTSRNLLTIVKRRKLQWYGHVSCSSGLAKTILQGTVKGGRRQGRQRERWEDNIREWTGLEFAKSQRAVENREKRRKLVAKSSMVPQRPSRLRDIDDDDDDDSLTPGSGDCFMCIKFCSGLVLCIGRLNLAKGMHCFRDCCLLLLAQDHLSVYDCV